MVTQLHEPPSLKIRVFDPTVVVAALAFLPLTPQSHSNPFVE